MIFGLLDFLWIFGLSLMDCLWNVCGLLGMDFSVSLVGFPQPFVCMGRSHKPWPTERWKTIALKEFYQWYRTRQWRGYSYRGPVLFAGNRCFCPRSSTCFHAPDLVTGGHAWPGLAHHRAQTCPKRLGLYGPRMESPQWRKFQK